VTRHAEIAGGGIAGLSFAIMLARRGWTARVHERSDQIRGVGTGLYIKNNAIEVLEELGLFERLAAHGIMLERSQLVSRHGRVLQDRVLAGPTRQIAVRRQVFIELLREAAEAAGVDIITGSTAIAADPAGELLLESGQRLRADLVVAADGVRSRVRDSFGIGACCRWLPTCVRRYLIESREITPNPITREHWSGRYRIGITPCGNDLSYIYQVCPERDEKAMKTPSDVALWSRAFPRLRREIEALSCVVPIRHSFSLVRCPRWHKGRIAIIGDAAHGLPPTLGQGVGLALMNARALADVLGSTEAIEEVLPAWEAAVRPVSDSTQRWALRYDYFTRQWPAALWFLRSPIIWAFRSIPALNRRMRVADQGLRALRPVMGRGRR
jgi:2-polyprenyl-6-methoxyphenol hydroxylase-like FAD-dependent oxidoreductase